MSSPVVRRAIAADVPSLGRLGALLVQEHHDFDPQRFIAGGPTTARHYGSFLGSQLEDPDSILLVAEVDNNVIAYAFAAIEGYDYLTLRGPAAVLHDLIVDPDYRGRGLGTKLLQEIFSIARARGAPRIVLSTAEQNLGAQRLFERLRFRRTMIEMTRELGADGD